MESVLANVEGFTFDFEVYVKGKLGIGVNEDKKEVCKYFKIGACGKGDLCPYKHIRPEKAVVCKHWLRGLCKKGDLCEFLHEYNLKKMPECWFFSKYGECSNDECMYLHIDPSAKQKECAWYNRGFCKHGQTCRSKHVRRTACVNYLTGFCPNGPSCSNGHPKNELPPIFKTTEDLPVLKPSAPKPQPFVEKSLDTVTCFKCGKKGHYANRCTLTEQ